MMSKNGFGLDPPTTSMNMNLELSAKCKNIISGNNRGNNCKMNFTVKTDDFKVNATYNSIVINSKVFTIYNRNTVM